MQHRNLLGRTEISLLPLSLDGRIFSAGLSWYSPAAEAVGSLPLRQKELGADCFCRNGQELGLGRVQSARPGLSMAAWLASRRKNVLCLLKLSDCGGEPFWWLCAVRQGRLVAGYADLVLKSRHEAHTACEELKTLLLVLAEARGVREAEAEPELIICEQEEKSRAYLKSLVLPSLIERMDGRFSIEMGKVRGPKRHFSLLFTLCILLLMILGLLALWQKDAPVVSEEKVSLTLPKPWRLFGRIPDQNLLGAGSLLELKQDILGAVTEVHEGWILEQFTLEFSRRDGEARQLVAHFELSFRQTQASRYAGLGRDFRLEQEGRLLKRSFERVLESTCEPEPAQLPDLERERYLLLDLAARHKVRSKISLDRQKEVRKEGLGLFVCPWRTMRATFEDMGPLSLKEILGALARDPVIYVRQLRFSGKKWSLNCVVYGQTNGTKVGE